MTAGFSWSHSSGSDSKERDFSSLTSQGQGRCVTTSPHTAWSEGIAAIWGFRCDECCVCASDNFANQGLISTEFGRGAERCISQAEGNPPASIFTPSESPLWIHPAQEKRRYKTHSCGTTLSIVFQRDVGAQGGSGKGSSCLGLSCLGWGDPSGTADTPP